MKSLSFAGDQFRLPRFSTYPSPRRRASIFRVAEDSVTNGVFVGLIALTLTSVGYALAELCGAVSGGIVTEAVRVFAP